MLPKVLFALIIPLMDSVYKKVAVWLNDKGTQKKTLNPLL